MEEAGRSPFVGRATEVSTVRAVLGKLLSGNAAHLVIEGEPGVGKSRLLEEAMQHACPGDMRVYAASASIVEQSRPFGVVATALGVDRASNDLHRSGLADLLSGRLEEAEPTMLSEGPVIRFRAIEETLALIEREALAGPVLVVVEDCQWADSSSLLTISAMTGRLADLPVGIIVTLRPVAPPPELQHMLDGLAAVGEHLVLGPLDESSVISLARELLGADPDESLRSQLARTNGNPLFVIELLRAAKEGAITIVDGTAHLADASMPPTLRLVLLGQISQLSRETVDVLRVAAVLGRRFFPAELATVWGRSLPELLPHLTEAMEAEVLTEEALQLCFRHDLVHEAIYSDLAAALRAGLHMRVARALSESGARPLAIAHHLVMGAAPGDAHARRWLQEAARSAMPRAPAVAIELLERALELTTDDNDASDALVADLVMAHFWAGNASTAEELARRELARPHEPEIESTLHLALIEALLAQGRVAESFREGQHALSRPAVSGPVRARLEAETAWGRVLEGDLTGAVAAAERTLSAAGDLARSDFVVCVSLNVLAVAAAFRGDTAEALYLAQGAVARAEASDEREAVRASPYVALAMALVDADRLEEAEEIFHRGQRTAEHLGIVWQAAVFQLALAHVGFLSGDWEQALTDAEAGLLLAEDVRGHHTTMFARCCLGLIAVHRNDLAVANEHLAVAGRELAAGGAQGRVDWLFWAQALAAEAAGNLPLALASLRHARGLCEQFGIADELPVFGPDFVRVALTVGARAEAQSMADSVEAVAARMGSAWARGTAVQCRGLVNADARLLIEATEILRTGCRPLFTARAAEDAAEALVAAGETSQALSLLGEAARLHEHLGASHGLARVEARARSLGQRRARRGHKRPVGPGWEGLTAAEQQVARLVEARLTNREVADRLFISVRTVETHIGHIFTKLGLSSRAELRRAAEARREAVGQVRPRPPTAAEEGPTTR